MTDKTSPCVICNAPLQEKAIGVFVDTKPNFDRKRDSTLGGSFTIDEPEFWIATICNNAVCLKSLLERIVADQSSALKSFEKTNVIPGSWFGPNGCIHYLKNIFQTEENMLGWHVYAYNLDNNQLTDEDRGVRSRLSHAFTQTEAKPVTVSIVGGYGHLLDGWFHFCDAGCALTSLFGEYGDCQFFAREMSHSGLPKLATI